MGAEPGLTSMHRHSAIQVVWLAYRDFLFQRRFSLCFVFALTAMLAPLLILFGLKFGLIDTLARRFIEVPRYREIVGVGSGRFDRAWFEAMAARSEVAFIIPNTRRIAASFSELYNPENNARLQAVQMLPTAMGDPLLATGNASVSSWPEQTQQVILSATSAQKLDLQVGDSMQARLDRRRDDRAEHVILTLSVIAIAPPAALSGDGVFVTLELLEATEDYRDGVAVDRFRWPGVEINNPIRIYPRFRLYANTIYEVAPLRDALLQEGVEVRTQIDEIETMQSLERNLSRVFWLIATIGGGGFLVALAANLLANVEGKRRELSVIRLLGFSARSIVFFPLAQGVLVAILGGFVALLLYFVMAAILNTLFSASLQNEEFICRLLPWHFAVAFILTLGCAALAATWAGLRAARIEPAEGLRDV